MEITNTRVYGLEESIYASGYPMMAAAPTEEEFKSAVVEMLTEEGEWKYTKDGKNPFEYDSHFKRAKKLAAAMAGSGHDCFLKGIVVQMDVKAPQYFWMQIERYHFIDIVSSTSKMHSIQKMDIAKCCNKLTTETAMTNAEYAVRGYIDGSNSIDDVLSNVPMGLQLTARMTTNYLQLKTIYQQRKNHRSKEWKAFCEWIDSLPFAGRLITIE